MNTTIDMGSAGARRAAALLGIAVCAETAHATLEDDCAKVDLKIGMPHAFHNGTRITVHCQVKSGQSYRSPSSSKAQLVLQLDEDTLSVLRSGTQPALLLWVPPKPSPRIYWHILDRRHTLRTRVKIPRENFVTPSLRIDLSRASAFDRYSHSIPRQDVASLSEDQVTRTARQAYRTLGSQQLRHPLLGTLRVTRLGWRHITRASKSKQKRLQSLRVVPYLPMVLENIPDHYVVTDKSIKVVGSRTVERRHVLMWYRNAFRLESVPHLAIVRVREEVSYPTNWLQYPMSIDDVRQTATLASWWCKRQ